MQLDDMILNVNDRAESAAFYTDVLGFPYEGDDGDFAMMRVTPDLMILLAAFGTKGGEHLAFSMPRADFDTVMARLVERGIAYGDAYNTVGNMMGPGDERGARGSGASIYFLDPSRHLIEIKHYER
jgi:catechol 2,3-dioxygenase-like lactoylglutathione lyase family enzyme